MWSETRGAAGQEPSGPWAMERRPGSRPTFAEVDLDAIAHNLGCVRAVAAAAQVYAVVKADAYGHGLIPVARRLAASGVDGICVALVEEGLALREAQVEVPILVLNGVYGNDHTEVLRAGLTPVVYELAQAQAFARALTSLGSFARVARDASAGARAVRIHLKVDTGMARLGVPLAELASLLDGLAALPSICVEGLMTHLASADSDPELTREQLERFSEAEKRVRASGHQPRFVHSSNSAGTYIGNAGGAHNLARVGIALYGVPPFRGVGAGLQPAMRVRSEVVALRELPAGATVGYGNTFRTAHPSRIATVAIGYGDGLLRAASNRGAMLVRGVRCPIVGAVAMDLTCLDVTAVPQAAVGDEVVVLGKQGVAEITAQALGEACGTVSYEVLTNLSSRVPRMYRGAQT